MIDLKRKQIEAKVSVRFWLKSELGESEVASLFVVTSESGEPR